MATLAEAEEESEKTGAKQDPRGNGGRNREGPRNDPKNKAKGNRHHIRHRFPLEPPIVKELKSEVAEDHREDSKLKSNPDGGPGAKYGHSDRGLEAHASAGDRAEPLTRSFSRCVAAPASDMAAKAASVPAIADPFDHCRAKIRAAKTKTFFDHCFGRRAERAAFRPRAPPLWSSGPLEFTQIRYR